MISRTLNHVVLALIVFIWVVPFVALVTTSFALGNGFENLWLLDSFTPTELGHRFSTHDKDDKEEVSVKKQVISLID